MRPFLPSCLALLSIAALVAPAPGLAIPAFARRFQVSCTTCHGPFPRLKPYGEEFAARGFALEPGAEPARATLDLGDPLLQLPRDFPLAIRFDAFAQVSDGDPALDFQSPWIVKMLAGGQIADKVGYYAYYILEQGEPGKIEDAYLQFSDVFGLPLAVLVGQFQLCDPIAKRELRLERLDYEIFKAKPFLSSVDLTYDRGAGLATGIGPVGVLFTVTNGNGIGPGDGVLDDDRFKNFGLHVGGGIGPVTLGAYGFVGKEEDDSGVVNTTVVLGPNAVLALGSFQLSAVYLERRDSNAGFAAAGYGETRTRGGMAEALVWPGGQDGRFTVALLYNVIDSDDGASERESGAVALSFLLRRNVRLTAEVDHDRLRNAWAGSVGTVAAF
jgi:hypothetical protein